MVSRTQSRTMLDLKNVMFTLVNTHFMLEISEYVTWLGKDGLECQNPNRYKLGLTIMIKTFPCLFSAFNSVVCHLLSLVVYHSNASS